MNPEPTVPRGNAMLSLMCQDLRLPSESPGQERLPWLGACSIHRSPLILSTALQEKRLPSPQTNEPMLLGEVWERCPQEP